MLVRKFLLVVCVLMVGGGFASVLGSVWTLGLALYVTAWVRPFEALDLLALDALSLASTAIMFGLCGIASMLEEGEEGRRSATAVSVGALTGVVHLSMCVVFLLCVRVPLVACGDGLLREPLGRPRPSLMLRLVAEANAASAPTRRGGAAWDIEGVHPRYMETLKFGVSGGAAVCGRRRLFFLPRDEPIFSPIPTAMVDGG